MRTPDGSHHAITGGCTGMSQQMSAAEHQQRARKHVFVVNGAPEFLNLMRELLQEDDFNVTTTNYVPDTYKTIEVLAPDLIVADLVVGQRAGWELLEQLRKGAATQGIPVILASTDPNLLARAEADTERYGEHESFVKPFDVDKVLALVHEVIGSA
jgi:DNA-binding NtrC family response regulator